MLFFCCKAQAEEVGRAIKNTRQIHGIINPRRVCAAKVTVFGLCVSVCVSVTQHLTFHAIIRATNDTNLLNGGWRSKILSDFL